MLKVTLKLASGKRYDLTGHITTSAILAPESALTALVGQATRTDLAIPSRSGVLPGRRRYGAIQAEIPFHLHTRLGDDMETLYKDFRQGWHMADDIDAQPIEFIVEADRPGGPYTLDAYADRHIAAPNIDMRTQTATTITVPIFAPTGLFTAPTQTGTGTVTITNNGDTELYPRLKIPATGGTVTAPSGAKYTLPKKATTIHTDPSRLHTPGIFPEAIAPGGTGRWVLSSGVALEWEELVASPWA